MFTPAANANGTGYASSPSRSRTTAAPPTAAWISIQSPNTMTINVTSVNDAPAGTDNTVTHAGGHGVHVFAAADFGFTDPNDSPANTSVGGEDHHAAGAPAR